MQPHVCRHFSARRSVLLGTAALLVGLLPTTPARSQTIPSSSCPGNVNASTCFTGSHENAYIYLDGTGSFNVYTDAQITIDNDPSIHNPIYITSFGDGGGSEVGESGAAGNGSTAGSITLTNEGALTWTGTQSSSEGDTETELIYVVSNGGNGGNPDEHGDGGIGGSGGQIEITNNGPLSASGSFASGVQGIHAYAAGGNGGPGNDASINHYGGNGGNGGVINQITNNGSIMLGTASQSITGSGNAIGIYAGSFGGAGGANGYSNGGGSYSGNGGGGNIVVVENNDQIYINWVPFNDGTADELIGIKAQSQGGNGANSAHNYESGGLGGDAGNVTVQNNADITVISSNAALSNGGGIVVRSTGGTGGVGEKQGDSDTDGQGGEGGDAADTTVTHNGSAQIFTSGDELPGIIALSRGGAGGSGGSGFSEDNSSGGDGGNAGTTTVGVTGTAGIHTEGDDSPGILAQGIGGYGGDGGTDGGLVGEAGGAGVGGSGAEITITTDSGTAIETDGDFSYGVAGQSLGGGGGTGGDFIGVLGGSGGDGGRGGDAQTASITVNGQVATHGDHSTAILVQSIAGGGGAGGVATGLIYALGGDGGAGGTGGQAQANNYGVVTTEGYAAYGMLAQSIGGGGGAAGVSLGGISVGGDGGQAYTANGGAVTVNNGGNITTSGDAAGAILAQSIGGGGGSGAGATGIAAVGGQGQAGGAGGVVTVTLTGGTTSSGIIHTSGDYAAGVVAQSIGGGGGNGGNVLDFSIGVPTLGIGGSAQGGGSASTVTVDFGGTIITEGDHAQAIVAQSVGGGGGNGGDAVGLGGLTLVELTIGGNSGDGGAGGNVTVTGEPVNGGLLTFGAYSHGVVAQSVGGGGGNGGNAYGFDASLNFSAGVAIGGLAGSGDSGGAVTVDWQGGTITTGGNLQPPAAGQPLAITDQGTNAFGIVAQSLGGGGGNGGSATLDQFVFSVPDGDLPIPTVNIGSAIGATGGSGGSGGTVDVTVTSSLVTTWGAGSHGVVLQSIGGGGGTGGDATALGVSAAIPDTTELPAITLEFALGGSGGVAGTGGAVSLTLASPVNEVGIVTYGDNANAIVAQSIGGGGGDAGVGSSATFAPGQAESVSAAIGLGGSGSGGGTGGTVEINLNDYPLIATFGSGSRGIVAQSIGGGGGTSQGGTGALYVGNFVANVQVGRPGGGGGDAGETVTVTSNANIVTKGGDADGMLVQSIGGGGGLGGTFGADGSLDDPNWVDVVLDVKHVIDQFDDSGATYSTTVTVGGAGGVGGDGNTVNVGNAGGIFTTGDWADGIVVQSIGGGGGAGGTAVADGSQQTVSANVGVGGKGGAGGDGGVVNVSEVGTISTKGYGAYGLLAQSIGGGGGQGGDGSTKATGSITVGSGAGGSGGTGGNGDYVGITKGGFISTTGDDAHALVAQSIGGGGGVGGAGNAQSAAVFENRAFDIIVGGAGGAAGSGDRVVIYLEDATDYLAISTFGDRSFGIVAQSIGGGGGIGGAGTAASITSVVVGGPGGSGTADGDEVYIAINESNITTSGQGSHAIVAQSIGGGGGIGGDASGAPLSFEGNTQGSDYGNGGTVSVFSEGALTTTGDYAFGILAQSLGGGGGFGGDKNGAFAGSNGSPDIYVYSGDITIETGGPINATGTNSIGIFAQSDSGQTNGTIAITLDSAVNGGSGSQGAAVHVDEGNSNNTLTITTDGSVNAASGNSIVYSGKATLTTVNNGTTQANVLLRNDFDLLGLFQNHGQLLAGTLIDADLENSGLFLVGLAGGGLETTEVGGDFTQFADGELRIDADLAANQADVVHVKGQATLDGTTSFNFLSLLPGGEALVLTADGGIAGELAPAGSGVFDFVLTHAANEVRLSVAGADFQTDGLAGSQRSVAGHLQDIWNAGGSDDIGTVFAQLENAAVEGGYPDSLSDLSPGVALAPAARSGPAVQIFTNSLMSCPVFEGDDALLTEGECGWARVAGRITNQTEDDGVAGFDNSRVTYQAGGQVEVADDWFLGGSLAFEQSWFTGDDDRVTSDGNAIYFGLAAKHTMGPWLFAASVGGGYGWYDTERSIGFGDVVAESSPTVQNVGGRLRAAYTFAGESWYLRPMADLELIYVRAPGYSESGAGALGLEYDDADQFTFAFSPALEVGGRVGLGGGYALRPFALAGVSVLSNDEWDVTTRLSSAPAGTAGFETTLPLDQVIGRVSAGVQLMGLQGADLRLTYDGEFSNHITSHAGALTVSVPF